jgi:predicted RNA binding protein YcfA (HicA-like mRNA interferase family)
VKTPVVSWKDVVKVLTKLGYTVRRQSGSHIILQTGTLLAIIKCTGLSKEEFLKLIK